MIKTLSPDSQKILNSVPVLINKTFPIPGRFRSALPSDIAELSRLLTNNRGERSLSYLGRPEFLSAYLHYFLPWNLYRLCILLPILDLQLPAGSIITDLGCGPLTFASALWITRPDLRSIPLEINCVDRVWSALEAGNKFLTALCKQSGFECNWKINLIKKDINIQNTGKGFGKKNSHLVCAVNMFNEQYDRISHSNTEGLRRLAANAAQFMHNEAAPDASILTVEPGIPQSGRFISSLREAFMDLGRMPANPCTHTADCPFTPGRQKSGIKQKWCHFAFEAADAPNELKRLSKAAKLQKERLAFSFLLTKAASNPIKENVRVISDAFPLPDGQFGRYGCSAAGLILLTGTKNQIERTGALSLTKPVFAANMKCDTKSGALIMELK